MSSKLSNIFSTEALNLLNVEESIISIGNGKYNILESCTMHNEQ